MSVGRLDRYLLDAELEDSAVEHVEDIGIDTGVVVMEVHDGVFTWDVRGKKKQSEEGEDGESEEEKDVAGTPVLEMVLKGINVEVRKGELVAVVVMVRSGKTSLLSCIMGEMEKISGTVSVKFLIQSEYCFSLDFLHCIFQHSPKVTTSIRNCQITR